MSRAAWSRSRAAGNQARKSRTPRARGGREVGMHEDQQARWDAVLSADSDKVGACPESSRDTSPPSSSSSPTSEA